MDVDPYFVTQDNGAGAPLHFAVTYGQLDMVHHLLNNGALVNQRDGKGWTPLHRAAHLSHLDGYLEVYELLLVSTYILPDPTQPHTMRAGSSMPVHTYTRIASTLCLTSQSRGADPSITTAAGDSYLSPGLKGVLDVALEHPDVRAALVDLNERYAGGHHGAHACASAHRCILVHIGACLLHCTVSTCANVGAGVPCCPLHAVRCMHADIPKAPLPHVDAGDWWALYDYGLDVVASWAADFNPMYPGAVEHSRAKVAFGFRGSRLRGTHCCCCCQRP